MKKEIKEIKMIFKLILYLTIVLLLINSAISQEIIDMELVVYKNNSIDEHWIHFTEGLPTLYYQQDGNYHLIVVNQNGNELFIQPIQFIFDYDGSVRSGYDYSGLESEALLFDFAIPYNHDMHEIRLYHSDKLIFSKILNFCNSNGVCDSSETFESCPADCPLNRNDVICLPDEDGICDPDCGQGVDSDCEDEFYPFAGEDKQVKAGTPVSFSGEVRNAGSGAYTYSWFFEDDGSTQAGQEVTHTFAEDGVFAVILTVTNQAGVSKEDTLLVTVSGLGCEVTDGVCDGVSFYSTGSGYVDRTVDMGVHDFCALKNHYHPHASQACSCSINRADDGVWSLLMGLDESVDGICGCDAACIDEGGGFWSWLGFSWFIDYFDKIL